MNNVSFVQCTKQAFLPHWVYKSAFSSKALSLCTPFLPPTFEQTLFVVADGDQVWIRGFPLMIYSPLFTYLPLENLGLPRHLFAATHLVPGVSGWRQVAPRASEQRGDCFCDCIGVLLELLCSLEMTAVAVFCPGLSFPARIYFS